MVIANIHNAKTNLSKLIERAEAGEEVVIARNGEPAVRLTPVKKPTRLSPEEILKRFRRLKPAVQRKFPAGWSQLDEDLAEGHLDAAWENGFLSDEERRSWADRLGRFEVWPDEVEAFIASRLPAA